MDMTGIASVGAITVICYLVGEGVKLTPLGNKWIPLLCGIAGGILGVAGMVIMPEFPAGDYITAVAVGIVSGLAATGVNQIGKQLAPGGATATGVTANGAPAETTVSVGKRSGNEADGYSAASRMEEAQFDATKREPQNPFRGAAWSLIHNRKKRQA